MGGIKQDWYSSEAVTAAAALIQGHTFTEENTLIKNVSGRVPEQYPITEPEYVNSETAPGANPSLLRLPLQEGQHLAAVTPPTHLPPWGDQQHQRLQPPPYHARLGWQQRCRALGWHFQGMLLGWRAAMGLGISRLHLGSRNYNLRDLGL